MNKKDNYTIRLILSLPSMRWIEMIDVTFFLILILPILFGRVNEYCFFFNDDVRNKTLRIQGILISWTSVNRHFFLVKSGVYLRGRVNKTVMSL